MKLVYMFICRKTLWQLLEVASHHWRPRRQRPRYGELFTTEAEPMRTELRTVRGMSHLTAGRVRTLGWSPRPRSRNKA